MRRAAIVLLSTLLCVSAVPLGAQSPQTAPATPAAAAPPDLSGYWDFSIDVGERFTVGEMTLGRSGDAYLGTLTPAGTNTLAIRLLAVVGGKVWLVVESREGLVTFAGELGADGVSMSGTVNYHHGQIFPMTAKKRVAASGG